MAERNDNLNENEQLQEIEDLIDKRNAARISTGSFKAFCSRLLSIKPKAHSTFQQALKQELLTKHSALHESPAERSRISIIEEDIMRQQTDNGTRTQRAPAISIFKRFSSLNRVKRFGLLGVPVAVISLVFAFSVLINPNIQTANALEVIANDSQVRAVIEEYDLKVQAVETRGDVAYIFLDTEDMEVTITVDLRDGTVGKIVTENGITEESTVKDVKDDGAFEAKAEAKGMTVEEFKEYLTEQKKAGYQKIEEKAKAMGMSIEEYKAHVIREYEEKAEAKGMTVVEFKKYLIEQNKAADRDFEAKAKENGMTVEEYKEYILGQKK